MDKLIITIDKNKIKEIIFVIAYIVIMNYLFIGPFKEVYRLNYHGQLYLYSFSNSKYIFSCFEQILLFSFVVKNIKNIHMSETVMLLLDLLYFVPGFIYQAVTNVEWKYIILYFLFWLFMHIWLFVIKPPDNGFVVYKQDISKNDYMYIAIPLCIIITVFMLMYTGTVPSVKNFIFSISNIYEIRALAKEKGIYWVFKTFQYWAVYFMILAITYYSERKKWRIVLLLTICELSLFLIQANRIFLFLLICAIVFGRINLDNKKMTIGLFAFSLLVLIESFFEDGTEVYVFSDVFRRFSIVPNYNSTLYFDFIKTHVPNYLRTNYARTVRALGIPSPYANVYIYSLIGEYYYGLSMNANTGMFGGGVGDFGHYFAPIVSSFGYIAAFRLFEKAAFGFNDSRTKYMMALLLATLSINQASLLSSMFSLQYPMLLFLSMILLPYHKKGSINDEALK